MKLSDFPAHVQARIKAQLDHDTRAVPPTIPQPERRPPRSDSARQGRRKGRLVVSLIGLRKRTLDDDNFNGACKHLRDAIAGSLGIDDGDKRIYWQYQQLQTRGREGVLVHIEVI